jgi:transcriptional regulator
MAQRDKYKVTDVKALHAAMRRHGFATLIAPRDGHLCATHVPLTLQARDGEPGMLEGHVAVANPIWRAFDGTVEAMAIFGGPDAYVSPLWYVEQDRVPTWNYVAVHAWGTPRIVKDRDEKLGMLEHLIHQYEAREGGWTVDRLAPDRLETRLNKIVFFQVRIERLEGIFKLSQDKQPEEQVLVRDALVKTQAPAALAVAEYMTKRADES